MNHFNVLESSNINGEYFHISQHVKYSTDGICIIQCLFNKNINKTGEGKEVI